MPTLYTNTYTDVDNEIADSDDVLAEFDRLETFLAAWKTSIESGDPINVYTITVDATDNTEIDPSNGLIQKLVIASSVTNLDINLKSRATDNPYRLYLSLRFRNPATTFTVSGPTGEAHVFGINATSLSPSQVQSDGFFCAFVIATYGANNGCLLQVFANNTEATTVGSEDVLTAVSR